MPEIKLAPKGVGESKHSAKKSEESSAQEKNPADYEKLKEQIVQYRLDILKFILKMFRSYKHNREDVPALAEDITQQTLIKATRLANKFDPRKSKLLTWLGIIAKSKFLDSYRKSRPDIKFDLEADLSKLAAPALLETDPLLNKKLEAALEKLTPKEKNFITQALLNDTPYKILSRKFNISVNTVRSRIGEIKHKLREILLDEGVDPEQLFRD